MIRALRSLRADRKGVTALEYGLLVAGIAIVAIWSITVTMGTSLNNTFNAAAGAMGG